MESVPLNYGTDYSPQGISAGHTHTDDFSSSLFSLALFSEYNGSFIPLSCMLVYCFSSSNIFEVHGSYFSQAGLEINTHQVIRFHFHAFGAWLQEVGFWHSVNPASGARLPACSFRRAASGARLPGCSVRRAASSAHLLQSAASVACLPARGFRRVD